MIRDVFYFGKKPNAHPREQFASSLKDAHLKCTTEHFWIINEYCDYRNFDWDFNFDFHPDEDVWAEAHNNVWPSQHQKDSGTRLCAKEHSDIVIYRNDVGIVKRNPSRDNWEIFDLVDETKFDFSWHPDPTDPPYIYAWGNQFHNPEEKVAIQYRVPGATDFKFMHNKVIVKPDMTKWTVAEEIEDFDFFWKPPEYEPPFIYVWGNQWYNSEEYAAVQYNTPGATQIKHMEPPVKRSYSMTNWTGKIIKNFDYSWFPHPHSPPYIYQFGTRADPNDGPKYEVPGNDGTVIHTIRELSIPQYCIETTLEDLVKQHPTEIFWAIRKNIDYAPFDFNWRPDLVDVVWELDYVHVFGSTESEATQTYFVSAPKYLEGHTSFKFVENITTLDEKYLANVFVKPDIFFVDKGNQESSSRFTEIQSKLSNFRIHKTRYLNSWVDTISRCATKSSTDVFWVLNSELDYSNFDFEYYPNTWQMNMVHVFGTQWSHWGTTFMVNKERFANDTKYVKIIEHLSNLNFVKTNRAKATKCLYDIVLIDHGNKEAADVLELLKSKTSRDVKIVPYTEDYAKTLHIIISKEQPQKEHFLWICSSVCDYTNFDFTYICDPFAKEQLHVFPSGKQKFGDTFFANVNALRETLETLDEYKKINFNPTLRPTRLPEPIIVVDEDTHVNSIDVKNFPYATFITKDNADINVPEVEPMCLWSPKQKNIIIASSGASRIIVPKEAKSYVQKELYDYPYVKKVPKFAQSKPLDIVFLSNGELCAEENWEHLQRQNLKNRVVRVDGVNGRTQAYHAAVEASQTPWCFTVFAKLRVNEQFDWNWQPDRMQAPKHYIFYAKNVLNDLIYGHQGMIAYNKKLTLATTTIDKLDFTLSAAHEVVSMISGTATFNTDSWSTWRTAFRETLKLMYYQNIEHNSDTELRLNTWLNKAIGHNAQWCLRGAQDAKEYFEKSNGDYDKLLLSFEWNWLRDLYDRKYGH